MKTTTNPPPFTQPFNYTGAYTNPTTGLLHLSARYYDPTLGRFTQQDPQTHPGDTNQSSPYPYTGDDPINHTDPTGNDWWAWGVETVIAVAALVFAPVAVPLTIVGVGYAALVELCGPGSPTADDPNVC